MDLQEFIAEHLNDDPASLVLQRHRWPGIDVALAAEGIAAKRKLRSKVPEWYADERLLFPSALSAEQCSSTVTARHKAHLALEFGGTRIADLTGGLGVDAWQFALAGATVLYNEMNPALADAAKRNFDLLGCSGVSVSNCEITSGNLGAILDGFRPDLVYLDPARRGSGGRKVFRLEDCSPNLLEIQDIVLGRGIRLMAKLSPIADISLLGRTLHNLKEIHIVEASGECKELLALCEPGFDGEYTVVAEIAGQGDAVARQPFGCIIRGAAPNVPRRCLAPVEMPFVFSFLPSEEKIAGQAGNDTVMPDLIGHLFAPGPALMKSGAFKLIAQRFGLRPLGPSAHLYLVPENAGTGAFAPFGKLFEIQEVAPLSKASLKRFAALWPDAEITARALPLSSDELRRKMALRGGGSTHIFAFGTPGGKYLIAAKIPSLRSD
ncbi:MAG: hypothetical protein J5632_04755 [Bacteroidales bacterium]|nr:hypothetical protein [Bacteroidales bacterium]